VTEARNYAIKSENVFIPEDNIVSVTILFSDLKNCLSLKGVFGIWH
jgi:hypothetical protein